MPFITTPERVGFRKGLRMAVEVVLRVRFGEAGVGLMPQVNAIHDAEHLRALVRLIMTATRLEEVSKACAAAAAPPPAPKVKSRRGKQA